MGVIITSTPENYYRLPPIGITETRARVGAQILLQYTIRCGSKECWFVGHAPTSGEAQGLLDKHECPTSPKRNELPSGYSTTEKLWDELDDATAAIIEQRGYAVSDRVLEGNLLVGYARGIAFALSMMMHPHFRTINDIVREAGLRYKMRTGKMDFRPTPGYRFNPTEPKKFVTVKEPWHGDTKPAAAKRAGGVRASAKLKNAAAKVDLSTIDTATSTRIKNAYGMGMFTVDELAKMNNITVETVKQIVGISLVEES